MDVERKVLPKKSRDEGNQWSEIYAHFLMRKRLLYVNMPEQSNGFYEIIRPKIFLVFKLSFFPFRVQNGRSGLVLPISSCPR